jgi:phospholipid/cholesterol/gamma-HCH transport system substrate-binding protein
MDPARRQRKRDPSRRFAALGITAILALCVVGYIAYTANSGLPLQSTYDLNVNVTNADRLIDTADVRVGGVRVGEVLGVKAVPSTTGQAPYARIHIAVSPSVGRLPVDSTAQVRPASVLGLTYLDLTLGHSRDTIPEGGTLPLARAQPSSDLSDLLNVFDRSSARHFQDALAGSASGLAGRGPDLNATIHSVNRLLPALTDVAAASAAPRARLADFLHGYEQTLSALSPASSQFASLVSGAATTFDALAGARTSLGATIDAAAPAESAATGAFKAARPALDGLAQLVVDLRPAGKALPATLRQINTTLAAGVRPLDEIPPFARDLETALVTLGALSRDPNTSGSLRKLTDLASAGRGAVSLLVPAQVYCNVISLFTQGFAGTFGKLGTGDGPSLGALFLEETGAQGENFQNAHPSTNVGINPIPYENQNGCQAGNEPWTGKQQLGNPPGIQSATTRTTVPPPGVEALAQKAGLLTTPAGLR